MFIMFADYFSLLRKIAYCHLADQSRYYTILISLF